MRGLATILLAAAALAASASNPSCYDDSGSPVAWFVAIKDNNGGNYAMATSEDGSLKQSQYDMQNGSVGGVSKTVSQLWDSSFTRGAWNDEPGYKASSKYGHTKGFVLAGDSAGVYMVHRYGAPWCGLRKLVCPRFVASSLPTPRSIPNWPIVEGTSYGGLPDEETTYAQSMLCFTLSLEDLNDTVGTAILMNRPAVYVNEVLPGQQRLLGNLVAALDGNYNNTAASFSSAVASPGSSQSFTVFAKTGKWGQDLYSNLVAPTLQGGLYVESWIRGYAIGPSCAPAVPYTVLDVSGVAFDGVAWTETQDHSKVRRAAERHSLKPCVDQPARAPHLHPPYLYAVGRDDA